MSQYPHDEFDDVPERATREGAHRDFQRVRNPRVGLWILAIVGVVVLVFGIVMFTVVKPKDLVDEPPIKDDVESSAPASVDPSAGADAGEKETSDNAAGGEEETAEASRAPKPEQPSKDSSASPSPSAEESTDAEESSAAADHATSVGVYNTSSQPGLAAQRAQKLTGAGYTKVSNGNWTRRGDKSAVYYKSPAQAETAKEVASLLGISAVTQTANIPSDITAVVGG